MNGHDLLWFAVSLQLIAVRQLNRSWRKHPNLLLATSWTSRGEEIPAMTRTLAWQAFDSRNGKRLCKGSQRSPFRLSIFVFRTLWTLHLLFALLNKQVKFWPCNRSHQIDLPLISRWTWGSCSKPVFWPRMESPRRSLTQRSSTWNFHACLRFGVVVACGVSRQVSQASRSCSLCFSYFVGRKNRAMLVACFTMLYIPLTTPQINSQLVETLTSWVGWPERKAMAVANRI